jgi:hypothetical protein
MNLSKLDTRELGKYFEQLLVSKLIKLGLEVFTPVLDKGIDFILRRQTDGQIGYYEIQVKSVRKRGGRLTINKESFPVNRENLFLVFFNVGEKEKFDTYLIPAKDVHDIFRDQDQAKRRILRLYTIGKDLERIQAYKWNIDDFPEVWKN